MKGQTLIEVLVALGLIGVVATALAGLVVISMGGTRNSKNQNLATQYAQEGMEVIRQRRDNDYVAFRGIVTGTYCLDAGSITLNPDCTTANITANGNNFLRKVTIGQSAATRCAPDVARVTVTVSWQDSKCSVANIFCHTSKMESCLSSVNPVPTL